MAEKLTDGARRALAEAQAQARDLGHRDVGTEHLLLGLVAEGQGVASRALARFLDGSGEPLLAILDEGEGRGVRALARLDVSGDRLGGVVIEPGPEPGQSTRKACPS